MPHQRHRQLLGLFKKRLKLSPVIGLVGARQTGKSTFLREIVAKELPLRYLTLDRRDVRMQAERAPAQFLRLEQKEKTVLCIDEAQKVPDLFDEIKAEVDENRRPGRFILSGSTEFSKKARIRESLTGRILTLQMYPMSSEELFPGQEGVINTAQFMTAVTLGGLPGICFVRDSEARYALFQGWLETLLYKDLLLFKIPQFNADRAYQVLEACARLHLPNLTELSRHLEMDPRRIKHYIEAFKAVFVLYELPPFRGSSGKARFCLFDSGVATHLGASLETAVLVRLINDLYSGFESRGLKKPTIHCYRTLAGSRLDLVIQQALVPVGILVRDSEQMHPFGLRGPTAFTRKYPKGRVTLFAPTSEGLHAAPSVEVIPWTQLGQWIRAFARI